MPSAGVRASSRERPVPAQDRRWLSANLGPSTIYKNRVHSPGVASAGRLSWADGFVVGPLVDTVLHSSPARFLRPWHAVRRLPQQTPRAGVTRCRCTSHALQVAVVCLVWLRSVFRRS